MRINLRILDQAALVGLAVLLLGGGVFVAQRGRAADRRLDKLLEDVAAREAELADAEDVQSRIAAALKANQATYTAMLRRLPESEQLGDWLANLDAIAQASQVRLNRVAPGPIVREALCAHTPVTIACQGSFLALYAVISQMEQMDRLVRIESAVIRRNDLSGPCELDLTCKVYAR